MSGFPLVCSRRFHTTVRDVVLLMRVIRFDGIVSQMMFKLKNGIGKENIRVEQHLPDHYKPSPPSPLLAPASPLHHTFAKAKRNQFEPSPIHKQPKRAVEEIDLQCDQNLELMEGGQNLKTMTAQLWEMELRCDEELDEPSPGAPQNYKKLLSQVKVVLEGYQRKIQNLQMELQMERERSQGWDRNQYYRQ